MAVTIREVAEEAGVSITSVSKVLHGRGGKTVRVSAETETLIRAAAARLNYVPNALARALRTSRTRNVGLVFENFGHIAAGPLYYVYLLDGVAQELFGRHYRLTILPEVEDPASLADGSLDGVLWCKLPPEESVQTQLRTLPVPVVALNAPPPRNKNGGIFVSCDNEAGARLVVSHLTELGHRRVLYVGEVSERQTPDAVARAEGFVSACRDLGLPVDEQEMVWWHSDARELAGWWEASPPHTAVFAWNEAMGANILDQAVRAGVRVPAQLSVVGFDSTRFCDQTQPRMTAVRQPIQEMARHATRLLLDQIEGRTILDDVFTFPCSLDVRDSTGSPRSVAPTSTLSEEAQSL